MGLVGPPHLIISFFTDDIDPDSPVGQQVYQFQLYLYFPVPPVAGAKPERARSKRNIFFRGLPCSPEIDDTAILQLEGTALQLPEQGTILLGRLAKIVTFVHVRLPAGRRI